MAGPTRTHLSDLRGAIDSTRGITGFVYRSVRSAMRLVGHGLDASLAPVRALLPDGAIHADARCLRVRGQLRVWRLSRAHRQPGRDRD